MGSDDRYQIVDAPTRAPGQCFICRSVSRGPFVDTRVDDVHLGCFYICFGCLDDIAEATDRVIVPKVTEEVISEPETESETFKRGARSALFTLKEEINGIIDAFAIDPDYLPDDPSDTPIYGTPGVPDDSEGQEGSGTGSDSPAIEDSEPPKRKRPARVSVDSGDGPGFRV